eukprot:4571141-Pleurochrysis_carterae.AAC.1
MASSGGGAIVNTASVAALRGTPTMAAYVASKSAVLGMTVVAAKEREHSKQAPQQPSLPHAHTHERVHR